MTHLKKSRNKQMILLQFQLSQIIIAFILFCYYQFLLKYDNIKRLRCNLFDHILHILELNTV